MEIYTKLVDVKELIFTIMASNANISPRLLSWRKVENNYMIEMDKYATVIGDVYDRSPYEEKGIQLVRDLHNLGIFHGDLSEDNVVVNPSTGDIRLIDFGMSSFIKDLPGKPLISSYTRPPSEVTELLKLEVDEIAWILSQTVWEDSLSS